MKAILRWSDGRLTVFEGYKFDLLVHIRKYPEIESYEIVSTTDELLDIIKEYGNAMYDLGENSGDYEKKQAGVKFSKLNKFVKNLKLDKGND